MTATTLPSLSVLDLVPLTSGSTAAQAIRNSIDLARRVEAFGYRRYWVAEHHLNPGVAGTSPALIISLIANETTTIRVGSGAVLMGHHTPLSVVEQFGILDAVHPGRIDLGVGRSGFRRGATPPGLPSAPASATDTRRTDRGLVIPPPFSFAHLIRSPRFALQTSLLQQPNAETPEYAAQVDDILALLAGTYRSSAGIEAHVVPGENAAVEVWILGSSGGESAEVAGRRGLPFAANYHVSPASVLDAVEAYRSAFTASPHRSTAHVSVSADVVVGDTDEHAHELAAGYGAWVRSIRSGSGAIPYPAPDEAQHVVWSDDDRRLVQDRIDTQLVGSSATVVERLGVLAAETGADELLITTITHDHRDRVRSYELLATAWVEATAPAATR